MIIIIALLVVGVGVCLWLKTDWDTLERENDKYYVDGLHIYYDRKLIARREKQKRQQTTIGSMIHHH